MGAHKIIPPAGMVPVQILHKLDPCERVTGYRRADRGVYGPITYERGGAFVDKANVEAKIGRRIPVQEIIELMKIVRAEATIKARQRYLACGEVSAEASEAEAAAVVRRTLYWR
jgi:hypothetical protein